MRILKLGVLIMNKLKIVNKFLFISFFIFILLLISLLQFYSTNSINKEFSSKERYGVMYAVPSKRITFNVQKFRSIVIQKLNGDSSIDNEMESITKNIDSNFSKIRQIDKENNHVLDNNASKKIVSSDITKTLSEWNYLKNTYKTMDTQTFTSKMATLLSDLSTMHTNISDNSNLTLDPDLDSYYCMDVVMFRQLALSDYLNKIKDLSNSTIKNNNKTTDDNKQLIILLDQASTLSSTIDGDLTTAFAFNNSKKVKVLTPIKNNIKMYNQKFKTLSDTINNGFIDSDSINIKESDFNNLIDQVIYENSKLFDITATKLDALCKARVDMYQLNFYKIIAAIVIAVPLIVYLYISFAVSMMGTIKKIRTATSSISNGILTIKMDLNSNDELGEIGRDINEIVNSLRGTISNSINTANTLDEQIKDTKNNIDTLKNNVVQINGINYQVASGLEQIAASSEEISATIHELEGMSNTIQKDMKRNSEFAEEVKARASNLETMANEATVNTKNIYAEVKEKVETSVTSITSTSIMINGLIESILKISEETNLLSLNASIEAARAGEYGRGFAVVASEVSKLASETSEIVNQIKGTIETFNSDIAKVTESSNSILKFVDTKVISDYNSFSEISIGYNKDAEIFKNALSEVSELFDSLNSAVEGISAATNELANSATNGAADMTDMCLKTDGISKATEDIADISTKNAELSYDLNIVMARFSV